MKANLNLISKKTALSTALLGVLMAVSPAYASVTLNSTIASWFTQDESGAYDMTVDGQSALTTNTTVFTVSDVNEDSNLVINITGSGSTLSLSNSASNQYFLSGATGSGTIDSIATNVSGGTITSTSSIGVDESTALTVYQGAVVPIRLLANWTSFTTTGNVTSSLSNVILSMNGTFAWSAVEIDNQTASTDVTATFGGDVTISLDHVKATHSTSATSYHTQIFGLSIANNEQKNGDGTTYYNSKGSTVSVAGDIGVFISYSDLADARNIRGVSNEGGDLTVGTVDNKSGITVNIENSSLPGVTISGLFSGTKQVIYGTDNFLATTTVYGDVAVNLVNVTQVESETTTVFGVNLSSNGNSGNSAVTGNVYIGGNVSITLDNSGVDSDAVPLSGYFGGYYSSQVYYESGNTFTDYYQSDYTKEIAGYIYIDIENASHATGTGDGIFGIYKAGSENLIVGNGSLGVEVVSKDASEGVLLGVYSASGVTTINGSIVIGVDGATDSYAVGAAVLGGSFSSGNIIVGALNLDMDTSTEVGTVTGLVVDGTGVGSVSVGAITIGVGADSTMTYGIDENMYGVAVTSTTTFTDENDALTQTGNINVILGGDNANLKLTGAVYGFVAGNYGDYDHGTTALTFGYTTASGTSLAFTSSEDAPLKGTFANFDKVQVSSGSSLYISSASQASNLAVDTDVFGDDYADGIDASDYRIYGMYSYGGIVALPESGNYLIFSNSSSSTTNFIEKLENTAGTVYIGSNVTLAVSQGENSSGVKISGDGSIEFTSAPTDSTLETGSFTNDGTISVGNVTVSGAELVSSYVITATNKLTVSSGSLTSTGSVAVGGDFSITGGTVTISDGTFSNGGNAYLEGGSFIVGSTDGTSTVQVQLNPLSSSDGVHVNTVMQVYEKSSLGLGTSSVMSDATRALDLVGLSEAAETAAVLVIDTAMVSGDYGYIGVGNDTGDLPTPVSTVSTASAYGIATVADSTGDYGLRFGDNSILVVNVNGNSVTADDGSHTSSAFTTTSDNSSVAIGDGATIVLYGDLKPGRYNITKGYSVDPDTVSGWDENSDEIKVYVEDAAGLYWTYTRQALLADDGNDTDYVVINVIDHQPVQEVYPTNIPDIVNDAFDNCDANSGSSYICNVLRDTDLTTDEKIQIVNSSSLMPFLGGVMSVAMNDMGYGFGELYNHLTMDSDTFGATGNLWPYQENNNFWIDVMGHWTLSRKLDGTGLKGAKYHDSTFGFILGYDRKIENRPFAIGAAFSFLDGNLKSGGNGTRTKNDHQSYGLHIWGNYSPNEHLNLIGSLHWLHNNAGLTQYINKSYAMQASGHVATDMFAIGLRAETTIRVGNAVNIIPHVEPRYIYGKSHAFDTKIDGNKIWRTKFGGNSLFQIPVGVAARADFKTESGWNIRPNLDISVIPQVGATSQKMTVTDLNNVSDVIYGQYQGKFAAEGKIGVSVDKGAWTFGGKYGLGGGTKGRIEQAFIFEGRLRF